jgi:transposase InsO family protein
MARHPSSPSSIDNRLRPDWYMFWQGRRYRILSQDKNTPMIMHLEDVVDCLPRAVRVEDIFISQLDEASAPIFAPTLESLDRALQQVTPLPNGAPTKGIPEHLLKRSDKILAKLQKVEDLLAAQQNDPTVLGVELTSYTDTLKAACQKANVGLTAYYSYRNRCQQYLGDRVAIAASLHRSTYRQSKMSKAQLHFIDTFITRYYAGHRTIRPTPSYLYDLAESALDHHTHKRWIDPEKCGKDIPPNVVAELCKVLDEELPMQAILNNPEKECLLSTIEMPSKSWFFNYLHWFESYPDHGRDLVIARYGRDAWEREHMVFDTFVAKAIFPLQYVFADHYLLDVFTVDEATRNKLSRLWLTVLIDAYSRCILGMVLLYEAPCIESIQTALLHAIWPKTSLTHLKIDGEWVCFGIPQQLFLDNAWAHHSHSLENVARVIGHNGKFSSIDLVYRPPYKGRYGALIERFFGNLSKHIKQELPGALLSSDPKHLRAAAKQACLLYDDISRYLQRFIVEYQNTPHSELEDMTPNQKWLEGMQGGLPKVPPLTPKLRRQFLRMGKGTRQILPVGICAFGFHYWSPEIAAAERIDEENQPIEYSFRYDPSDISTLAIFREDDFVGDAHAKELLRADGTPRPTSLWERELAKQLARKDGGESKDLLHYLNESHALHKQRAREKRALQRKRKELAFTPVEDSSTPEETCLQAFPPQDALSSKTGQYNDAYTEYLAAFES